MAGSIPPDRVTCNVLLLVGFYMIGCWAWNVWLCTCEAYAVVLSFIHTLKFPGMAWILDISTSWAFWVMGLQVHDILLTCWVCFECFWEKMSICLCAWICRSCVPGSHSTQKVALELLNLKFGYWWAPMWRLAIDSNYLQDQQELSAGEPSLLPCVAYAWSTFILLIFS